MEFADKTVFEEHFFRRGKPSPELKRLIFLQAKKEANCYISRDKTLLEFYRFDDEKKFGLGQKISQVFGIVNSFDEIKDNPKLTCILAEGSPEECNSLPAIPVLSLSAFLNSVEAGGFEDSDDSIEVDDLHKDFKAEYQSQSIFDEQLTLAKAPTFFYNRRQESVNFFIESLADKLIFQIMQIPAGTFLMGSPNNELDRQDREGIQYEINVSKSFMGKYPITQSQWQFVASLPLAKLELNPSPSRFEGYNHPVEQVSWFEAVEFCDRLSRHTGRPYRLPTEAEWEYACRANTTTSFHFGETITTDLANYNGADEQHGAYGRGPKGENRQTTTPVGHFGIANAFGLCDMHGNVWEWCQDQWRPTYGNEASKRKIKAAPQPDQSTHHGARGGALRGGVPTFEPQPDQSTHRVARGGSWYTTPERCRSASRIHFEPDSRHPDLGFRVVCALEK